MKLDPLDILFAKYVKLKAGGLCEHCGKLPDALRGYQCHHAVVHRQYLNTRWEEDNCVALCGTCHDLFGKIPSRGVAFMEKKIGVKRCEELELIARTYHKMSKERKEEIKAKLKEKIGGLE